MFDDNEDPLVVYGDDGPVFTLNCPKCRRFMRFPETMNWRERFDGHCGFAKVECGKCGPVDPDHIGWAGDFT
jgi:hypothetical protein